MSRRLTPQQLSAVHRDMSLRHAALADHYDALLEQLADEPTPVSRPSLPPVELRAPWYDLALADLRAGVAELAGSRADHPRILAYLATVRGNWQHDETPWCSAAVNAWMGECGIRGTDRANARSWSEWGRELSAPIHGCIVVLWRDSPTSAKGHVGLYAGASATPGHIKLLGGNQGNRVSVREYPAARVLSYRWPTGVE